ncbi:hypothetical protein DICVIV_09407 [Dictyocaulus viviparus]|uniref:Uncharacterized protein n=1 Tax=Dictyocaulus viviparus TaxID=29172 RepID=A0A0D8XLD2_DICVI|nr:hypothetical protein DICVIV_09407 [Dictyocaulus viviparus]
MASIGTTTIKSVVYDHQNIATDLSRSRCAYNDCRAVHDNQNVSKKNMSSTSCTSDYGMSTGSKFSANDYD